MARINQDVSGEKIQLGAAARRRIGERFSLQAIAQRYEELYEAIAADVPNVISHTLSPDKSGRNGRIGESNNAG